MRVSFTLLQPGSKQRLAPGGGAARATAWRPGGHGGLERGLDGVGDKLGGLGVDGDVAAEQHAADDLPGMPGRVLLQVRTHVLNDQLAGDFCR